MLIKQYWVWFFLAVLGADMLVLALGIGNAHFFLKLLLMPILMMGLLRQKQNSHEKNWRLILAGLVVAWAGDTLLLFSSDNTLFFILGLICFLLTHISYIIYYFRYNQGKRKWLYRHPITSFTVVLYSVVLFGFLLPSLHALKIPVALYTLVITIMLLQAFGVRPYVPAAVSTLFIAGAISFVISDSLLAWNKFAQAFPLADTVIIGFYGLGQLLIVKGAIDNTDAIMADADMVIKP